MPTSPPRLRRIATRTIALAAAIALSVLGLGTVPAAAAGPAITVTPSADVADGATLTVTGSGFANTGTGVYVAFGPDDVKTTNPGDWSTNAGLYSDVEWISAAQISAEGTFATTLTATLQAGDPEDLTFAVYTFKAHGVPDRSQDTVAAVTMAAPEPPAPSATVTPETTDVESGSTLTVTGANFAGTANGVYVTFGPHDLKTTNAADWNTNSGLYSSFKWVRPADIAADGSFTTTVTATIGATTPDDLTYAVYTFASQGSTNRFFDTYTPIQMAGDEPEPTSPTVTVTPHSNVVAGSNVTVTGSNFAAAGPGVYVAYGPQDVKSTNPTDWWTNPAVFSDVEYVPTAAMTAGGFTVSLTAAEDASNKSDRTFAVYTMAAHGSGDRSQDTVTPVTLKAVPKPTPKVRSCAYGRFAKGSVTWGVKKSFRQYVSGPIADGNIRVGKPAIRVKGGEFRFRQGVGKITKVKGGPKIATLRVKGSVIFNGHYDGASPALRLVLSDLKIQATGKSAYLRADVSSKDRQTGLTKTYANVRVAKLGGVTLTDLAPRKAKKVAFTAKRVVLTAQGAPAFGGFYTAGTALDPVKVQTAYHRKAKPTCVTTGGRGPVDGPR